MARYIDTDKLERLFDRESFHTPDERWRPESEFAFFIDYAETEDVEPVIHAHWTYEIDDLFPEDSMMICSNCGEYERLGVNDNYCGNCGAKMDEEVDT